MELTAAFGIAFKITIFVMVLSVGLATTTHDLAYLRRHPGLLVRSVLAMAIVAPVVALLLWRALPIGPAAAIALIAGALAPGLPTVPRTEEKVGGNVAFAISLMFVTTLLGVITVPLWLEILRRFVGIETAVPPVAVARTLVMGLLLPLLAGVALRRLAPRTAERVAGPMGRAANALVPGLALIVLIAGAAAIARLSWAALAAMVIAPVIALAIGHALGGPEPRDRSVLAVADAGRFPALAALIATTSFPEVRALPAVIAYLIVANLVTIPYLLWRKRVHGARAGVAPVEAMPPPPGAGPIATA